MSGVGGMSSSTRRAHGSNCECPRARNLLQWALPRAEPRERASASRQKAASKDASSRDQRRAAGASVTTAGATTGSMAFTTAFVGETFLGAPGAVEPRVDGVPVASSDAPEPADSTDFGWPSPVAVAAFAPERWHRWLHSPRQRNRQPSPDGGGDRMLPLARPRPPLRLRRTARK